MTISREQFDGRSSEAETVLTDRAPKEFGPPFDEPIYTVNEAARILRISPNQTRAIFRKEPGVHDLSHDFGKPSRFRGIASYEFPIRF